MIQLKEITDISSGYSFRGKIPEKEGGGVSVICMKDVSLEEGIKTDSVVETALSYKHEPDFLQAGDILFVACGSSHYATLYDGRFNRAVASPHFFVIRTKSLHAMPEFIAWQLNQLSAQRYFEKEAEGSVAKSIKRTSLERASIFLPNSQKQQALLRLYKNLSEQKRTYRELIMNVEKLMRNIALGLEQDFNTFTKRIEKQ